MTRGKVIHAADLFCGAGGTSQGLVAACERMGLALDLVAVNHWPRAVETHAANHPGARHYCARIDQVVLKEAFPGGKLDLLVASPECVFHSIARGGKPVDDQRRESAWGVLRWVDELRPRHVVIENVPEFRGWGPLGADHKPLKSKKGVIFAAWIQALRSYGYVVEWHVLNAADYGDPTTRRRLFVQARRGRTAPAWPTPSHAEEPGGLFPASPWRAAREVIDWTVPSRSIFGRKRPLAQTTLERIAEGLRRFGGPAAEPFLVAFHAGIGRKPRVHSVPVSQPAPTIVTDGAVSLVEPFVLPYYRTGTPTSVGEPLPTVTAKDRFGVVEPVRLDVLFRMLQPHELAAAMGFPKGYRFTGNRGDQVRQIGNAVCVSVADALCSAALRQGVA